MPHTHLPPPADLTNCDREPIHVPGRIQPFGLLFAVDRHGLVNAVSGNVADWLDRPPQKVLGRPVTDVVGCTIAQGGEAAVRSARRRGEFDAVLDGPNGARPVVVTTSAYAQGALIEIEPAVESDADVAALFRRQDELAAVAEQAGSVQELLQSMAALVSDATGFHRTMVYRFDARYNGDIIVEHTRGVAPRFLDHHFPHTDIPAQARALYLRNRIRVIPDVGYEPVPLISGSDEAPLDLSAALLRSVSPLHIEYLRNMEVGATLVMSLVVDGVLWGMLVCHHYQPHHIGPALRRYCDIAARLTSLQLQRRLDADARTESARLLHFVDAAANRSGGSVEFLETLLQSPEVLEMFGAQTLRVSLHGRMHALGRVIPTGLDALILEACGAGGEELLCTDRLQEFGGALAARRDWVGGALLVRLSRAGDYLLLLREERPIEVRWAGKPDKGGDAQALTPRRSFELWVEEVRGSAAPWSKAERVGAERLAERLRATLATDLRQARASEQALREQAAQDALTGLPNRVSLLERLREAIARAARGGTGFGVLFLDLDRFKPVNDRYGHAVGDEVLRILAHRFGDCVRASDMVARIGGDEFVAVVEGLDDAEGALQIADKLIEAAQLPVPAGGAQHRVSASIGVCHFPTLRGSPGELLRAADQAMYAAKQAGRACARLAESLTREQ